MRSQPTARSASSWESSRCERVEIRAYPYRAIRGSVTACMFSTGSSRTRPASGPRWSPPTPPAPPKSSSLFAWTLGYRWTPRLADLPDLRLWRIDRHARYSPLDGLARNHINTQLIAGHWDEICRLTASLRAGTVVPSAILRTLQRGPAPSSLARALAELGRVIKTLHVLEYVHDPAYRRMIHDLLSRGERRNSLARDVFHGQRGHLRKHYQVGQENQLDSLGIMVNVIVLWQTVYTQAALEHLAGSGYPLNPADVARLTPLGHPTINLDGRYRTTRPPATGLRPLRTD
jgi:hypothetical protein